MKLLKAISRFLFRRRRTRRRRRVYYAPPEEQFEINSPRLVCKPGEQAPPEGEAVTPAGVIHLMEENIINLYSQENTDV